MISFGEYMVSEERTQRIVNHPEAAKMAPVDDRLKQVHDADYQNWLDWKELKKLPKQLEQS
jgi:hypothetical protein